jgi:hypothetical protein
MNERNPDADECIEEFGNHPTGVRPGERPFLARDP